MAQPTTDSERVTAFREPSQQLLGRICATARRALRPTAILLAPLSIILGSIAHAGPAPGPAARFNAGEIPVASGLSNTGGVAVDGSGNVYIANSGTNQVFKETLLGGAYTQSTAVSALDLPRGLAVDGNGNVYIADTFGNQVLKETPSGSSYIQTVVVSALNLPAGVAVDTLGNVYIADTFNNRVLEETPGSGGTYAQTVLPTTGLSEPGGVAVDVHGFVYIADSAHARVLKETFSGSAYSESVLLSTGLSYPYGIAVDGSGNNIYIGDNGNGLALRLQTATVNFGSVNVGSTSPAIPLIFSFGTGGTLGSTAALTQGATGLDFANAGAGTCTAATAYGSGATCTINVTFAPRFPGARPGAAQLLNSSGNVLATAPLTGTGVGPQVSFLPGAAPVTVASALSYPSDGAVDGSGNRRQKRRRRV